MESKKPKETKFQKVIRNFKSLISSKSPISTKKKAILIISLILVAFLGVVIFRNFIWFQEKETYMVEMRDGTRLATDIYLPKGFSPYAFVLFRTPYGKSEVEELGMLEYRKYGIGIIAQDQRGCYDSEGEFTAFASDGMDANDTIEWLNQQEWYNGNLGTFGYSAHGITQYFQLPYINQLNCQIILVGTPSVYSHAFFQNGAPRKMLMEYWFDDIGKYDYYAKLFENVSLNNQFAQSHQIPKESFSNVSWPSVHVGGWYDCFSQGTLDGYMGYQDLSAIGGENNAYLIMGPWVHSLFHKEVGELIYPDTAENTDYFFDLLKKMLATNLLNLKFFSYTNYPKVHYFVMGPTETNSIRWNRWAATERWPVPAINQSYYFTDLGNLSETKPEFATEKSFLFDPRTPVSTSGGSNLQSENRGPTDQRSVEYNRLDILKFRMNFTEITETTGHVWGHLFVRSNCTDTDFTIKLKDIYPDGREMIIQDGIVRMRFREGMETEKLLDGNNNTIYEAWVDLWSTSYVFLPNHSIEAVISSSNFPRFDVNPNTGAKIEPVTDQTVLFGAQNTILIGGEHASEIILPIYNSSADFV